MRAQVTIFFVGSITTPVHSIREGFEPVFPAWEVSVLTRMLKAVHLLSSGEQGLQTQLRLTRSCATFPTESF